MKIGAEYFIERNEKKKRLLYVNKSDWKVLKMVK